MLKSLYIKNYALIDSLEIEFTSGFSVITGETGAGKSIILGALALILGQRADIKSIKQGESKCVIEGVFDVSAYDLKRFCEEHDLDYDADTYILRREIHASGKSRAFINDTPATLTNLKDLGSRLIDVHSQHQNLLLADDLFQLHVVDTLAGTSKLLESYQDLFKKYKTSEQSLLELKRSIKKNKEEEEYLRFQLEALNEAQLVEGEQDDLEAELEVLSHAEEIKSGLFKCFTILSDEEMGVAHGLREALTQSQSLEKVYTKAKEISERIQTAFIDMQDLGTELERSTEDIEYSPERLAEVQARLDKLYGLQTRYKQATVTDLIAMRDSIAQQIGALDNSDLHVSELEKKVKANEKLMVESASKLSAKRKQSAKVIEKGLVEKISLLGMPNVRFECEFTPKEEADTTGMDNLVFQFSANKNIPLQPVGEIASGGEISRLMLCLKSMIAGATALPSIIFDEIDTGVSGEIADKMGVIMQEFGKNMQVLAITHLPQIAAKGKVHYKVYKSDEGSMTTTNLIQLSDEERLVEIAGMLSGAVTTDAAISNAREMLGFK